MIAVASLGISRKVDLAPRIPPTVLAILLCESMELSPNGGIRLTGVGADCVSSDDGASFVVAYLLEGGTGTWNLALEIVHRASGLPLGHLNVHTTHNCLTDPSCGALAVEHYQFTGEFDIYLTVDGERTATASLRIR